MANRKRVVIEVSRRGRDGEITIALGDARYATKLELVNEVNEQLSSQPAVVNAAEDAVTTAIAGRHIVETKPIAEPMIAHAITDSARRAGPWITMTDGSLHLYTQMVLARYFAQWQEMHPDVTGYVYALTDQNGRLSQLAIREGDGKFPDWVVQDFAERMGTIATDAALTFPTDDWAHWGDSMTMLPPGSSLVDKFAALTGRSHYQGGAGGQTTRKIAARMGAVPTRVTVTGNTIPASGTVVLTSIAPNIATNANVTGYTVRGSINGVSGVLAEGTSDTDVTFTRDVPGDPVPVDPGALFLPEDGDTYGDRLTTIWAGRNDSFGTPIPTDTMIADIQQMIDYLASRVKRVFVIEVPPWATETTGTAQRTRLDDANAALEASFPAYWAPLATWLRTSEAETAAGITFTAQDTTDISNGITPTSFRGGDPGHLNGTGNTAAAAYLHDLAQKRGWL